MVFLDNVEIKQLICDQLNVHNPSCVFILDRTKIAPPEEDVVKFIKSLPYLEDVECEKSALAAMYMAMNFGWAHGTVTGKRTKHKDVHTVNFFIDDTKTVRVYDGQNKKYVAYPFEVIFVAMY